MCMQQTVILSSLCKWKRQKWLFLLLNGTQYARPKNGGTQYARPIRAVRSTQGGRGCHPQVWGMQPDMFIAMHN